MSLQESWRYAQQFWDDMTDWLQETWGRTTKVTWALVALAVLALCIARACQAQVPDSARVEGLSVRFQWPSIRGADSARLIVTDSATAKHYANRKVPTSTRTRAVTIPVKGSTYRTVQRCLLVYGIALSTPACRWFPSYDTARDTTGTDSIPADTLPSDTAVVVTEPPGDYKPDPSTVAELPRVWIDTKMPAVTRTVPVTCATLQNALNGAQDGDALTLPAGSVCTGHYTYSGRHPASAPVILTTATPLPPAGTRVTRGTAGQFAVLETNNSQPALDVRAFASGLRVVGIAFRAAPQTRLTYMLASLGPVVHSVDSLAHDITLDRVYMQGHDSLQLQRCVAANAARVAVIDSWLAGCHYKGADAQAVIAWNSPGPVKLVNNYLEGSGENVLFGGADPSIPNLVASDIEIRRNWFRKPDAWRDSTGFNPWTEKNILELKSARRVLVEANVFEGSWPDGQTGYAIWIKSANQSGKCDWCGTSDVVFRWNLIRHATAGIAVTRGEAYSGGTYDPVHNVEIANVAMDSVGTRDLVTSRRLLYLSGDMAGISVAHVTATDGGNYHALTLGGSPFTSGVFRDNLLTTGNYGVVCDGKGFGATALANCWGGTFAGNALVGKATGATQGAFPAGNVYPATLPYTGTAGVDRAELAKRLAGVAE